MKDELSAWKPKKRLAREEMDQIRLLATDNPRYWTKKVLASTFKISYSAVGRILKSRFEPSDKIARRQNTIAEKLKAQRQLEWRLKHSTLNSVHGDQNAEYSDGDLNVDKGNTVVSWQTQLLEFHNKRKFRDDMVDSSLFNNDEIIDKLDHLNSPPMARGSKYPTRKITSKEFNQREHRRKPNLKYNANSDVDKVANINKLKALDYPTESKKFDNYRRNKNFKDSENKLGSKKSRSRNDVRDEPKQGTTSQFSKSIDKLNQIDNENLLNIDGKDTNSIKVEDYAKDRKISTDSVEKSSAEVQDKRSNIQKLAKAHDKKDKGIDGKSKITFNEQEFNHLIALFGNKKKKDKS